MLAGARSTLCPQSFLSRIVTVVTPDRVGHGALTVHDGDVAVSAVQLDVVEATALELELFYGGTMLEARLLDDADTSLYAADIVWEIAPVTGGGIFTIGNVASIGGIFGAQSELHVRVTRGALSAELELVRDPDTIDAARWRPAP